MVTYTPQKSLTITVYGEKPVEINVKLDFYDIRVGYGGKTYSLIRRRETVKVKYGDRFTLYTDIVNYGTSKCTPYVEIVDADTGSRIALTVADKMIGYMEGYTFQHVLTMPEKPQLNLKITIGYIYAE